MLIKYLFSQHLLLLLLIFILFIKIYLQGGIEQENNPNDPLIETVTSYFVEARASLSHLITTLLPQPQAALLSGIVLGVKSDLPKEFKQALQNTSTIHIVVVSGQNLTMLGGFILALAPYIGRKKTLALSLVITTFYSILTGLQIPVLRASIMLILATISQLFNREEGETVKIIFLTALLMLIYQPNWLFSISFQLSFLATIGVVALSPQIMQKLTFIPQIIKQDLSVSIAAQLTTLPIIALNFHQLSLFGIFSNTLVIWTIPFIMISGAITLITLIISPILASFIALIPNIFLTYFVYIIYFFNSLPITTIYIKNLGLLTWIGYYFLLFNLYLYLRQHNHLQNQSHQL